MLFLGLNESRVPARYYNSYLEFFRDLLLKRDVTEVLEEYVFSAKANVGGPEIEGQPRMLNRFFAALVHPLIHTGNGLEFGILGLVAEGKQHRHIDRIDCQLTGVYARACSGSSAWGRRRSSHPVVDLPATAYGGAVGHLSPYCLTSFAHAEHHALCQWAVGG